MTRATKLDFSANEEAEFLKETGFQKLEGKGVLAIIDLILIKRVARMREDEEHRRWEAQGGY